jgi:hypothetical protein
MVRRLRVRSECRCGEGLDTDGLRSTRRSPASGFDHHRCCDWIAERDSAFAENLCAKTALVSEGAQKVPMCGRLDQRHTGLAEACPAEADPPTSNSQPTRSFNATPRVTRFRRLSASSTSSPQSRRRYWITSLSINVSSVISRPGRRRSENIPLLVKYRSPSRPRPGTARTSSRCRIGDPAPTAVYMATTFPPEHISTLQRDRLAVGPEHDLCRQKPVRVE